jgi:cathepsin B
MCIASKGNINKVLSAQDMVSCDKNDFGCQGGYLDKLWDYLVESGIVTDACFPYVSLAGKVPPCPFETKKACVQGSTEKFKKYYAKDVSHYEDVESACSDIMENGPILAGFQVYRDFFNYKSGVYQHKSGSFAGGHAIKIVGWGVDTSSGLEYWTVANSWGESWGMKGYFWIKKGSNECEIETMLWAGKADPEHN